MRLPKPGSKIFPCPGGAANAPTPGIAVAIPGFVPGKLLFTPAWLFWFAGLAVVLTTFPPALPPFAWYAAYTFFLISFSYHTWYIE